MTTPPIRTIAYEEFLKRHGDIESQPIPKTYSEIASHYLTQTLKIIKTEIAPSIYSNTPQNIQDAVKTRFWIAPALAFCLTTFSETSWLINTTSGCVAEVIERGRAPRHSDEAIKDIAAGLFAFHAAKGLYNIASCLSAPSIQNTLGAAFDIAAAVKCASIITNCSTAKAD